MEPYTVIYVEPDIGIELWQFFQCFADNDEHAEEQCHNAYPNGVILWINTGHGPQSQRQE